MRGLFVKGDDATWDETGKNRDEMTSGTGPGGGICAGVGLGFQPGDGS